MADSKEHYRGYVVKSKAPIATAVKRADLRHNSDVSRHAIVDDKAIRRIQKYKKAIALLTK